MTKSGRKSFAELTTIIDATRKLPPPPPAELTKTEQTVWRNTVATLPPDWLTRPAFPIAIAYCRHVVRLAKLDALIEKAWGNVDYLNKLMTMAQRETKAMTACARGFTTIETGWPPGFMGNLQRSC